MAKRRTVRKNSEPVGGAIGRDVSIVDVPGSTEVSASQVDDALALLAGKGPAAANGGPLPADDGTQAGADPSEAAAGSDDINDLPEALERLFDDPLADGDSEADQGEEDTAAADMSDPDSLASKLADDPAALDGLVVVPGDDEKEGVTLGEMREVFEQARDLDDERIAYEQQRMDQENEILTARMEVTGLVDLLSEYVPEERLAEAVREHGQRSEAEAQRHLDALKRMFPQWKDPVRYEQDKGDMQQLAALYGFKAIEFEKVRDSRMIKLLADFVKVRSWVDKVRQKGAEARQELTGGTTRRKAAPNRNRQQASYGADEVGDVLGLMAKGTKVAPGYEGRGYTRKRNNGE